jgi:hypothetical protein
MSTCNKITAHEHFLQLISVFVLPEPDRIVLRVKLLPEVWNRFALLFIAVATFEVIHVESPVRIGNA